MLYPLPTRPRILFPLRPPYSSPFPPSHTTNLTPSLVGLQGIKHITHSSKMAPMAFITPIQLPITSVAKYLHFNAYGCRGANRTPIFGFKAQGPSVERHGNFHSSIGGRPLGKNKRVSFL